MPWQRRSLLLLLIALAVLALGGLVHQRREPPRLLGSDGRAGPVDYLATALRLIAGAHSRVTLVMFVLRAEDDGPVHSLCAALVSAAERGVVVRVVLDRGRDWRSGEPDDKHLAALRWLSQRGVRVLLDEMERTTHAKVLVVDGRRVVIGSHNWTRSALTANREWSLLIDDPQVAADIEADCAGIPGWDR
jgi:phosphatidylserine/phosphatidylglycerophosphate/cardiolipin synthase-like enzyme